MIDAQGRDRRTEMSGVPDVDPLYAAAKIIDRLMCLLAGWDPELDYSAADSAVQWLNENDSPKWWLSVATRDRMEKAKPPTP